MIFMFDNYPIKLDSVKDRIVASLVSFRDPIISSSFASIEFH